MVYVKFTFVKLIIYCISLICLILLLSTEISWSKQKYSVQIAASKIQQNIPDLAKKYEIADSIFMIKSGIWHRYLIGNFENFEVASDYKNELFQKTKLKYAFVQEINDEAIISSQDLKNEAISNPNYTEIQNVNVDSLQVNPVVSAPAIIEVSTDSIIHQTTKKTGDNLFNVILGDSKVSALKKSLIDYCENNFPIETRGFYIRLIEKSFQYPVIFLFIALILFFLLNIIAVFLILNYTIKKKNKNARYISIYGKMYEEVLLSYMFGAVSWEQAYVKLKKKNRKENRKILTSILLNFRENFKGELDKFIPEIFLKLGLEKDSLKSANSIFNYKKVQGIMELTSLYSEGALGIVSDLINDSNDSVRAEAQTAFIRLNPDDPFKFFHSLTKPFTRWTQLSAFNLLRVNQLPVPSFTDFLNSKHPNIRNFSLRMITYFQQLENISKIIKMLDSEIVLTRYLSYKAINDLRLYEGKEIIKTRFWNETVKNKQEIIKTFRNIGSAEDFDFLEAIINSESISLKIESCRSMYYMNLEGRERLLKMKSESVPDIALYIAHVTDERN